MVQMIGKRNSLVSVYTILWNGSQRELSDPSRSIPCPWIHVLIHPGNPELEWVSLPGRSPTTWASTCAAACSPRLRGNLKFGHGQQAFLFEAGKRQAVTA